MGISGAALLIVILSACSNPTGPDYASSILNHLQEIPTVPFPPETSENSTNPAYLKVKSYCYQVAGHRSVLINIVQRIEEEQISAQKTGQIWQWQIPHSDGVSSIIFQVTRTDTLYFTGIYQGPAYSSIFFSNPLDGWIYPESGSGIYWRGPDWSIGWEIIDTRVSFGAGWVGEGISITEEIDGGSLEVNAVSVALIIFKARWDSLGHGTSWGFGSGDW